MTTFEVMTRPLTQYGTAMADYGDEVDKAAPFCREWAGQTQGLTGPVLSQLAGPTREVANGLADRYDALARNWVATGQQLEATARSYHETDQSSRARLDASYPGGAGGIHDAEADGHASLPPLTYGSWSGERPPSDPGEEARDSFSFEIKAVDGLFHKVTGWHLTEPIDALAGNWKTLDAQAAAYDTIREAFLGFGDTMTGFATAADHVWDGQAATAFQTYARRFGNGLRGEAEVAGAVAIVLRKLSSEYGAIYQSCVDLIKGIVRQLEGAAATALVPVLGEINAVRKVKATVQKFLEAKKLVDQARRVVQVAEGTLRNLVRVVKVYEKGAKAVDAVKGKIDFAKKAVGAAGNAPGVASNLAGLLHQPTYGYGGPTAPNYR
jgi:hypothetical protein